MFRRPSRAVWCELLLFLSAGALPGLAQESGSEAEPITRIVWQDREKKTLMWGQLVQLGHQLKFQPGGAVDKYPVLDKERHELVQMERVDNVLLVGVRDNDKGQFLSGWVALDLGVDEESHGDHSDYNYGSPPRVIASVLDKAQGNPAHLYVYNDAFYLANDHLNGFTRITPAELMGSGEHRGTFHRGGGGHITLAAVDQVSYATWIQEKGRIDVSNLSKAGKDSLVYSFHLKSGGLHGATENSGRVFFAPAEGIAWVDADTKFERTAETVEVHYVSLGKDAESDRPLRTGAFTNQRNWVLFTTGQRDGSALCLVDAAAKELAVVKVSIPVADGLTLTTPEVVLTEGGKRYAFCFHDRKSGDVKEKLTVIDLDPNGDRNLSDAAVAKTIDVGASRLEGHYGHHTISFDGDARYGLLTNPGDGDIWLLALDTLKIVDKFKVSGMPTKIIAVGGEESKH